MKKFPTLYKQTSTGAIQQWSIESSSWSNLGDSTFGVIRTRFGQVDGKIQETEDVVSKGKNVGRSNETTPIQQAELEAEAKWTKQKKKGYVESIKEAEAGEIDEELIEGGILPMLAQNFSKQGHKIIYPAYVQPKFDGARCIAIIDDGNCTLWTRTRKPILGVPHIQRALEKAFMKGYHVLDGELYNHDYRHRFEELMSFIKQVVPKEGHEVVQYHVYDVVNKYTFGMRAAWLRENLPVEESCIVAVSTVLTGDEESLMDTFENFLKLGYEGAMVRNAEGLYANKRSYDLQKIKEFDDAEFPIVGIEEGRGKLAGHAIFVCCVKDRNIFESELSKLTASTPEYKKYWEDNTFTVKLKGSTEFLKQCFEDHSIWQGHNLTVKYQGITNKNDVPRFPVGVAVRDYE